MGGISRIATVCLDSSKGRPADGLVRGLSLLDDALWVKPDVVCLLYARRDGVYSNSVVIIGRDGEVTGIYDKASPVTTTSGCTVMEGDVTPGPAEPPPVPQTAHGNRAQWSA